MSESDSTKSGEIRRLGNPDWQPPPRTMHAIDSIKDAGAGEMQAADSITVRRLPETLPASDWVRQASLGVPEYPEALPSPIDRRLHEMSTGWSRLDSFFKRTDVTGHVRVRQTCDFERIDRPTRNRGRLRARLGLTHHWNSEIWGGIRLTTGDRKPFLRPEDPRRAPLSYQDTGDVYNTFEFDLDRIFITYSPEHLPEFFVTGGKFRLPVKRNPIFTDPVGDLVWDEAVQPEGIAAGYTHTNVLHLDEVYWTVGQSVILALNNDDEASLLFAQVWLTKRVGLFQAETGIAWYDWSNLNPDGNTRISYENNFGNEVVPIGPNRRDVAFASKFNVVNPIVVLTLGQECDQPAVWPIQFVWELFHNLESFDRGRDTGYSVGAQYGPAVLKSQRCKWDWKLYYTWQEVQQESLLTPVAQNEFQRATNFSGNWVGLDVYPWEKVEVRFWWLSNKPILPIDPRGNVDFVNGFTDSEWRFQVDVTAYF